MLPFFLVICHKDTLFLPICHKRRAGFSFSDQKPYLCGQIHRQVPQGIFLTIRRRSGFTIYTKHGKEKTPQAVEHTLDIIYGDLFYRYHHRLFNLPDYRFVSSGGHQDGILHGYPLLVDFPDKRIGLHWQCDLCRECHRIVTAGRSRSNAVVVDWRAVFTKRACQERMVSHERKAKKRL